MFAWLVNRLPWNRPTLADLPETKRRRIKALMLGAGAPLNAERHGKIHIAVETVEAK